MTPENDRDSAAEDAAEDGSATEAANGTESAAPDNATADAPEATIDGVVKADPVEEGDVVADGDAGEETVLPDGEGDDTDAEPSTEQRLVAAEALAAAHWDRLVRLQAEMENQRKRAQRDVSNARKFALDGIAGDLLPIKDSLELGIRAASGEEASVSGLLEGSELTLKMLAQVLEKNAILEVDPEGERFDPEFHQAMSMQEVEGVAPNTVTGVMQKGYTLNERLIRPALVMVSK